MRPSRRVRRAWSVAGGFGVALLGSWLLSACGPYALDMTVNSTADVVDAAPGDGVCETATPGECTFRAAIEEANATEGRSRVALAPGATYDIDLPTNQADEGRDDLDVAADLTVEGNGATLVNAANSSLGRLIEVTSGDVVFRDMVMDGELRGSSLVGGVLRQSGQGAVVLDRVTVTRGAATQGGGIHVTSGLVSLVDSTVTGNTVWNPCGGALCSPPSYGGGVRVAEGATLSLTRSSVVGNLAGTTSPSVGPIEVLGGGVMSEGAVFMSSSTVAGNGQMDVRLHRGTAEIDRSTIRTFSTLNTYGLGQSQPVRVRVVGSALGSLRCDVAGQDVASEGYNVLKASTGCAPGPGDQVADPQLGALGDHGGPTETMLLGGGSPALDAIPAGTPGLCDASTPTDQRGEPRPMRGACDAGAVEVANPYLSMLVGSAADGADVAPGDGVCDAGGGSCTLRAAVDEANAAAPTTPGFTRIDIAPGVDPVLSVTGASEDGNATGDLDLTNGMTIVGARARITAAPGDRVFHEHAGGVALVGVDVVGGSAPTGGGIEVGGGSLVATDVTVAGNVAPGDSGRGGGVHVSSGSAALVDSALTLNRAGDGGGLYQAGGTVLLDRSTVASNEATKSVGSVRGGGIDAVAGNLTISRSAVTGNKATAATAASYGGGLGSLADVTVVNSTFSGNQVAGPGAVGGAVSAAGSLSVASSTITGNSAPAGAGIEHVFGTLSVRATVLANAGSTNCAGNLVATSAGYNLSSDGSCPFAATGDQVDIDPLLGPVTTDWGTSSARPAAGSPARNAVPVGGPSCDGSVADDQHGTPRPLGGACDIGAVEQG